MIPIVNEPEKRTGFGWLGTDELTTGKPRRLADFEHSMLSGCTIFASAAIVVYSCLTLPLLLKNPLKSNQDLTVAVGLALALGLVGGILFLWRGGLSGLCGSVAGLVPAGVFWWLRIRGAVEIPNIEDMVAPEFPLSASWTVPSGTLIPLLFLWYVLYRWLLAPERLPPKEP